MTSNPIEETEPTWVDVDDAARFAGVSRSTILRACSTRGIPVREDGRRRLVPLERVLIATAGKEVEALRRRLAAAASLPDAPAAVREWGDGVLAFVEPLIDRLLAAEARAAVAEAKLALLEQEKRPLTPTKGKANGTTDR
ncbi:MAG: helix-turn-helix domain-containing protein [Actinomycetota bacterium]